MHDEDMIKFSEDTLDEDIEDLDLDWGVFIFWMKVSQLIAIKKRGEEGFEESQFTSLFVKQYYCFLSLVLLN